MTLPLLRPMTCDLSNIIVGLWIDDPVSRVLKQKYFDTLHEHGVEDIAVMVDDSPRPWAPKYSLSRIRKLGDLCQDNDISLALTDWPYPDKVVINKIVPGMERLILESDANEWEDDMEPNWTARMVRGFRPRHGLSALDLAGDYWLKKKTESIQRLGDRYGIKVRSSLTTFTSHTENGRAADVAPHVDIVFQQGYATRHRRKKHPRTGKYTVKWVVPQDHTYGPGHMVKHTLDRTLLIPGIEDGKPEMGCGHAAYDQGFPMGPQAAMALNIDIATGLFGVRHHRFWSSKWCIGIRRNDYASKFLKSLALARGRGIH